MCVRRNDCGQLAIHTKSDGGVSGSCPPDAPKSAKGNKCQKVIPHEPATDAQKTVLETKRRTKWDFFQRVRVTFDKVGDMSETKQSSSPVAVVSQYLLSEAAGALLHGVDFCRNLSVGLQGRLRVERG